MNSVNKSFDNEKKLEEKMEKDYSEYRLKRLLEILLEIDLKRLEELYQSKMDNKSLSNRKK